MAQSNNGDKHEILNASMLVMLAYIFDKVIVYAPKSCCNVLKRRLANGNGRELKKITYKETRFYSKFKYKQWVAGLQILYAMLKTDKNCYIFFSEINSYFFVIYNMYSRCVQRRMFSLCHSDLEMLNTCKCKNLQCYLNNYIFKKMNFAPTNKMLVLGDSIKRNLKSIVSERTFSNIITMIHPYYSDLADNASHYKRENIIHIGIVGAIKEKDIKNFRSLDCAISNMENVKVYSLSKFYGRPHEIHNIINLNKDGNHLERGEYDRIISDMDVLYYPYPSDSYRLSASGAIYEAIVKGIPILAEENTYFQWLFDSFGEMGILYKGTPNWSEMLKELQDQEHILLWKENMRRAAEYINPHNYCHTFKSLIKNCNDERLSI